MSVMDVELANAYGHCNSPALGTDARRPARLRKSGIALSLSCIQVFLREITCTSSGSGAKIRGQGEPIYLTKPIQASFLRKFAQAYRGNTAWDNSLSMHMSDHLEVHTRRRSSSHTRTSLNKRGCSTMEYYVRTSRRSLRA